jgi:hypothetical protein
VIKGELVNVAFATNGGSMPVDTKQKSFTLANNFGRTYIAVFTLSRVDSFKDEESFKTFLKKIKSEVEKAKNSNLFEADSTYVLGGFDVQVATAGVAGAKIIVTLGGSLSPSIVEYSDPVKDFGVILSRMLNIYFDKQCVLSDDPTPGKIPYKIEALQLDQSIIIDSFDDDFQQYNALTQKNIVEGKSPLLTYGHNNSDVFWDYYFFDAIGDLVEITFNVAQILIENAASPTLDFAEPAMNILPDILASDPAPIANAVGNGDAGFFGDILNFFGSMFDSCSAPDLNCDGSPDCDTTPDCGDPSGCDASGCDASGCDASGCDAGGCDCNFS